MFKRSAENEVYKFGKIDFTKPINPKMFEIQGAEEYMVRVLDMLNEVYGFKGKNVADIGGSNISREMAKYFRMNKMVCVNPISQWNRDTNVITEQKKPTIRNEQFVEMWEKEDYFVLEERAEDIGVQCWGKFDIICSMSTFEHVDDITLTLNNVNHMLKRGGVFFSTYEPIFSCAKGHHVCVNGETFAVLPELDFIHLKYSKDEAREYVKSIDKFKGFEDEIVRQAFDSHVINRKTLMQHLHEIFNSIFDQYALDYWVVENDPEEDDVGVIEKKFGKMRYNVRGIAVTAFK